MARVDRTKARWAATLVTVALLMLAFPSSVAAATLTLTPTFGVSGITVNAHGAGYPTNQPISVKWDGALVATGNSGSERRGFDIPFVVPAGAPSGSHTVTMCVTTSGATGCGTSATANFTVVIPAVTPAPTSAPSLPPPPTPIPGTTSTPVPTVPQPTVPLGAATPTPEPPPIAVVTPAPTPPNQFDAVPDDYPDLLITGIEVTQGIQDLQNRMPLVADRRTYARVYVQTIGEPSWPNTYGVMEARRDGQQIGWIWPENGPITALAGGGSRIEVDDTLNFRLPFEWLNGEVTLRAFIYSYNVASVFDEEPVWQNNLDDVTVTFHPAIPLTVHLASLHMHRSFHPDDVERIYHSDLDADFAVPGGSETMRIVNGLYRFHPVSRVNVDLFTGPVYPIGHADGHEFNPGDCETTMLSWNVGNPLLTDWEPLMDDPAALDPQPGEIYEADNDTLAILDKRLDVVRWFLDDDGVAIDGTNITGPGPLPLPGTPVFVDGCKPSPSGAQEMNKTLALYRVFYDWDAEEDLFVGMIHTSLPTEFRGGISTDGTDAVSMRMSDSFSNSSPWSHNGAETLAHEAGHAAGLKHVPCKDDDNDGVPDELAGGDIDLSHPVALTFPICTLANPDPEGYYGWDAYWQLWNLPGPTVIGNSPAHEPPNEAWPWMAYENPGFADPYHYCRLLDFYGVPCDPTDLGIPWSEPDAPAGGPLTAPSDPEYDELPPGSDGLVGISGFVDSVAGTGKMEVDYIAESPTSSAMRRYSGQYVITEVTHRLAVLDSAGVELASVPIQQQETSHEALSTIGFELLVPSFPNAKSYQIISAGRDVARLDISPSAPTVVWEPITEEADTFGRIKLKFHWDSSDADGDPLTHTLLYAPDGEHWQVLAGQLNQTDFEFLKEALPGGEAPVFQVIAFDGTRASSAVSAPIDPVPGLPPTAVLSGLKSTTYPAGVQVVLEATAFDPEDRALPGDAIVWSSSLDGELGTGSELVVDDLSVGMHTIIATVTDSDGLTDTSSFELEVDGSTVQSQPDPAVVSAMDAIFAAVAAGEDPATAYEDTTTPFGDLAPWLILVVIAAAAAGGGFLVWRSRWGHKLE
ncbi:MAG: hypothetical protein ACRDE9_02890 [Candidatus Limnocylindria bacterium]